MLFPKVDNTPTKNVVLPNEKGLPGTLKVFLQSPTFYTGGIAFVTQLSRKNEQKGIHWGKVNRT